MSHNLKMLCCSLKDTIAEYLANQNPDKSEIESYIKKNLCLTPLDELYEIFKYIDKRRVWNYGILRDLFLECLHDKIDNLYFYINIAYIPNYNTDKSLAYSHFPGEVWLQNPKVHCQIAIEDGFSLLDSTGNPIPLNNPYRTYSIGNSSFNDENEKKVIRMLLNSSPHAMIKFRSGGEKSSPICIEGLMNNNNEKIYTVAVPEEQRDVQNTYAYPLDYFHDEDVSKIYKMYRKLA